MVIRTIVALGLIAFLLPAPIVRADEASVKEYEIKAAFLYNFTKFVNWPDKAFDRPDAPYVIGVIGKDPFGATLDRIFSGRKVNNRGFVVRHLRSEAEGRDCHVLFIATPASGIRPALRSVQNAPVLTVGDEPGFAASGGVVGFIIEDSRIRFEINPDAARRANLSIAAQLMKLARIVRSNY